MDAERRRGRKSRTGREGGREGEGGEAIETEREIEWDKDATGLKMEKAE